MAAKGSLPDRRMLAKSPLKLPGSLQDRIVTPLVGKGECPLATYRGKPAWNAA